jgi:O-antigen/teichoic acid export membrane protein
MARSIGAAGRGTLVTLTTWGQILGWQAMFSLDKSLVVLTTGEEAVMSPDEALRAVQLPVLSLSVLAVVVSVILGRHFFSSVGPTAALAAFVIATAEFEVIAGWLLATRRRLAFIGWRLAQPTTYLAFIVAITWFLRAARPGQRTVAMAIAAAVSVAIPVIFATTLLVRRHKAKSRSVRPLLRFAATANLGNLLIYLNGRLDLLTLSLLVSPKELGYYATGAAIGQLTMLMANAGFIRGITGERVSADFIGIALSATLASLIIVAAPLFVPLLFGASFEAAVPIARILAIGGVINYALQAASGRLLRRRQPSMVVLSQGLGVVVFAIGITLFPTLQGVAWSSVTSFAASLTIAQTILHLPSEFS